MIKAGESSYKVVLTTANGKQLDITPLVEKNASWSEDEDAYAGRIEISAINHPVGGTTLSNQAALGAQLHILAGAKNRETEVFRGTIKDWQVEVSDNGQLIELTAFDTLHNLINSEDNLFAAAGTSSNSFIQTLASKWGIPIGTIDLPAVNLPQTAYKGDKIAEMIQKTLEEVERQTKIKGMIRARLGKIDIIKKGSNATVYYIDANVVEQAKERIDITDMITRILVIGKDPGTGRAPLEATIDGRTSFGILQRVRPRSDADTLEKARADARTEMDKDGVPGRVGSVTMPDIPTLRKGDRIYIKAASMDGYYWIKSVTHNIGDKKMNLELDHITS